MSPTDTTPNVSPQVEPQVDRPVQDKPTPMGMNWEAALFEPLPPDPVETPQQPQPEPTQPATAEPQLEAQPPDAQQQPAEQPPQEQAPTEAPEEVIATEADQALYDSIAAELKAQYPNADPILLKRLIDDKFTVKQLLAKDEKKSKQISQLLKRVTKKPERVVTDFERSLMAPVQEPQAQPQTPVQPQAAPPQMPQQPQQPQIPDHLNWHSEQDAFNAEAQAWAEYGDPDATPQQRDAAARKLAQIRDLQHRLTMQSMMSDVDRLAEQKANQIIQAQLGDVLPTLRQTAAEREAEASHAFAVQELEKAGMDGIRDMVKPVSAEPLVVGGDVYENTPLMQMMTRFPHINRINVTHDANGKPYAPKTAERLTRIERYRAAAEMWAMTAQQQPPQTQQPGTQQAAPSPAAVQQAYQAGMTAAQQSAADRARQTLNSGGGATSVGGGASGEQSPLQSAYRQSGAFSLLAQDIFSKPKQ